MVLKKFFLFICIPFTIFSYEKVVHDVHVDTGELQLSLIDHEVQGAVPMRLSKYVHPLQKVRSESSIGKKMEALGIYPYIYLHLRRKSKSSKYHAEIFESDIGKTTYFELPRIKNEIRMAYGDFRAKTQSNKHVHYPNNPYNNKVTFYRKEKKAVMHLADGTIRYYKYSSKPRKFEDKIRGRFWKLGYSYRLTKEIAPNGEVTLVNTKYDKLTDTDQIIIQKVSPYDGSVFSWIKIMNKFSCPNHLFVETSDHQKFSYELEMGEEQCYILKRSKEGFPDQEFFYTQDPIQKKSFLEKIVMGKEQIKIEYYFPVYKETKTTKKEGRRTTTNTEIEFRSHDYCNYKVSSIVKKGVWTASFDYGNGNKIYDHNNIMTKYYSYMNTKSKYDCNGKLYSRLKTTRKENTIKDSELEILRTTSFVYDDQDHLIKETNFSDTESYTTSYEYNNRHLCVKETTQDRVTEYEYLDGTNLVTCKKVGDLYEYFEYDEHLLLAAKKIVSGNFVKEERYTRDPETKMVIEKSDGIFTTTYEYDQFRRVIKESTPFSTIEFSYDAAGNLVKKRFPLGATNTYEYDVYGNLISIKEVGAAEKQFTYDDQDMPIQCEIAGRISTNTYDKKGNLLEETNLKGAKITYEYDEFDRCIKKMLPEIEVDGEMQRPTWHYAYDIFDNLVEETSPLGNTTKTTYNLLNKPVLITFADGSTISHSYDAYGNIIETTDKDGTKTTFTYDIHGRCLSKKSPLMEELWEYDGILLYSYTDGRGLTTFYSYDEFGRKTGEECEGRTKSFVYDEMGNVTLVTEGELEAKEVFDCEGRVIETSQNGFHKIQYEYNDEGKKAKAISSTSAGDAIDLFFYDSEGNLTEHQDPDGNKTLFYFDDWTRTIEDPLGNKTIETFDSQDRLIQKEKLSPEGEVLLCEKTLFDLDGNIQKLLTQDLEVEYFYDALGQKIREVESGKKETIFSYDCKGRIATKTLPNGITFTYAYDSLDRELLVQSSDGSIDYEYFYTGLDLTKITDHTSGKSLQRKFSRQGELIEEINFDGFKTSWFYDQFGRKKRVELPDGSAIEYDYEKNCMVGVSRINAQGETLYSHRYLSFDANQHVENEALPLNLGSCSTSRDLLERPTCYQTPFHQITQSYNANHLIKQKQESLFGEKDFDYDPLSQLIKEGDTTYDFDAMGNSKEFTVNDLNQITSSPTETFSYDHNGNLCCRKGISYTYDSLDRLTHIAYDDGKEISFAYDPLSRLYSKTQEGITTFFLYDNDAEIGTLSSSGEVLELKVLGLGLQGDIGGAVAIEFDGIAFVPLHDLQGNIVALVNSEGEIVESYDMNAFGMEGNNFSEKHLNPWRFSSKRFESGLVYFGLRFYDPYLKRWISPDPAGFVDSRNLYLFNLNNPANRLDQFGLHSIPDSNRFGNQFGSKFHFAMQGSTRQFSGMNSDSLFINKHPTIQSGYPSSTFYDGTASIYGKKTKLAVFCARKYEFNFSEDEKKNGYFNLMDHLPELIHGAQNQTAFLFYQNGINNSYEDFVRMGQHICHHAPEGTLIIGAYNPTSGVIDDLKRARAEQKENITDIVETTAAVTMCLLDMIHDHAQNCSYLYLPHSEAGGIAANLHLCMPGGYIDRMRETIFFEAVAPAKCIPKKYGIDARNFFSKADRLTSHFAEKHGPDYNVYNVDAITPISERSGYIFDHEFTGRTYTSVLKDTIFDNVKRKYGGFYVGKHR